MCCLCYGCYLNRFLSADSIVPNPANPQSLNRYSYVLNRPLVLTDPSGHMPSDGCGYEGCLTDADSWASNFVQYLLDNTDFSDPSDNPVGQFVLGFYFDELESWNPIQGPLTNEEALMDSIRGTNAYLNASGMHPADALQAHHSMGMLFDLVILSAMYGGTQHLKAAEAAFLENYLAYPFGARNPNQINYTSKVQSQMTQDDFHGFPRVVDNNLPNYGRATVITGGDGILRTQVDIPGYYKGRQGVFRYIFEPDGLTVNHRMFHPLP